MTASDVNHEAQQSAECDCLWCQDRRRRMIEAQADAASLAQFDACPHVAIGQRPYVDRLVLQASMNILSDRVNKLKSVEGARQEISEQIKKYEDAITVLSRERYEQA